MLALYFLKTLSIDLLFLLWCYWILSTAISDIIVFLNRLWWLQYFYFRCKSWQNNPKNNRDGNHLRFGYKNDWVSDQREGSSWWCHHNWQSDWKNNKIGPIFYTGKRLWCYRSVQFRLLCRILNFTSNVLILAFMDMKFSSLILYVLLLHLIIDF